MKPALLKAFGGAEAITVGEVNLRDIQPNEAVVSVEVAGANPLDLKMSDVNYFVRLATTMMAG